MHWVITADVENPKGSAEGTGVLPQLPRQVVHYSAAVQLTAERLKSLHLRFRLLDGDGIPYYLGVADEEGFAPLDWAQGYSGCTEIQFAHGDCWETL